MNIDYTSVLAPLGLHIGWNSDGEIIGLENLTDEQRTLVDAAIAAYDPLAVLQKECCARLQAEKWARMMGKFRDSAGHLYDVDVDSRALLNGKITTINSGKPLPAGFIWKTAEKDASGQTIYAPHTAETLVALAFEIEDWTESIFRASEAAQGAVMKALDTEAALAAEAAVLWP